MATSRELHMVFVSCGIAPTSLSTAAEQQQQAPHMYIGIATVLVCVLMLPVANVPERVCGYCCYCTVVSIFQYSNQQSTCITAPVYCRTTYNTLM
jgi:hypothetical protein